MHIAQSRKNSNVELELENIVVAKETDREVRR